MAIVTLTSDIGNQDFLIGAVKGQLLCMNSSFNLVDITHQLPPFNYSQAAYIIRNAVRNFPEFSFHIILANLFDRIPEKLLLAVAGNQYIFCADNGLLSMIMEESPELVIGLHLMKEKGEKNLALCIAVIGKTIQDILDGKDLREIGETDTKYQEKNHLQPNLGDDWIEGQIIFIDHFENVIVNITREQFEKQRHGRKFQIRFRRDEMIERICESYADVPEGEKLALFNSGGYLEIAINKGNAAGLFGLQRYTEQSQNQYLQSRLLYQSIRVNFI
jgi:hypothetical protein